MTRFLMYILLPFLFGMLSYLCGGCASTGLNSPAKASTATQQTTLHLQTAKTELNAATGEIRQMPDQPHKDAALSHTGSAGIAVDKASGTNTAATALAVKSETAEARAKADLAAYKGSEQRKWRVLGSLICGLAVVFSILNAFYFHFNHGVKLAIACFAVGVGFLALAQAIYWLDRAVPWILLSLALAFAGVCSGFAILVWKNWDKGESLVKAVKDAEHQVTGTTGAL